MKILSIDDSSVARRAIGLTVESLGYEFLEAPGGAEGLALLAQHRDEVALVLLDWNMPGMNGLEVLQRMKTSPSLSGIPVMMVTTEVERGNMVDAVRAGAKHYLTKPYTPEQLALRIMQCLGAGR